MKIFLASGGATKAVGARALKQLLDFCQVTTLTLTLTLILRPNPEVSSISVRIWPILGIDPKIPPARFHQ